MQIKMQMQTLLSRLYFSPIVSDVSSDLGKCDVAGY